MKNQKVMAFVIMQDEFISRMIKNLPVLRAAIDMTQEQLGSKLGVSRQTIVAIENGKSPLTWSLYWSCMKFSEI